MALIRDTDLDFLPQELEFYAEDENVTIMPNFSLPTPESKLECLGGVYGPFQPNIPIEVPLWLAAHLNRARKCTIQPPGWMQIDHLEGVLELERSTADVFQPLPFHFIEITHLLFVNARDTFGDDAYKIKDLIESIRLVRKKKIDDGLQALEGPMTVKMNNLAAMEINMIRPFFAGTLDRHVKLHKMVEPPEPRGSRAPLAEVNAPARQLRARQ